MICVPGGVLYEIDVHTDSEVARYPIPKPPNVGPTGGWVHGITLDSNGDIWLGGSESGYVYKVSGSTGDIICQEDVGDFTKGIAVDPEDNVWVADYTRDEVIKVNGLNCGVINRYPVGDGPVGVAVDFDGSVWTVNYDGNSATKLNVSSGNIVCTADVGEGPYTFSDMTGFNLWGICKNRELDPTMATVKSVGNYILNFTALPFPKSLSKEDFENASVTVFIHFRDNITSQTFPLFPSREELTPPLNRQFIVNVSMRDATEILIERVTPNRYNINPGTELEIHTSGSTARRLTLSIWEVTCMYQRKHPITMMRYLFPKSGGYYPLRSFF